MGKHLSQPELDKFLRHQEKEQGKQGVKNLLNSKRTDPLGRKKRKSIFLSHCHLDKKIIPKIALLFNKIDVDIYIDWMDHTLPKVTDKETASAIRKKIEHCNRFLFLATAGSLGSKWCNWELGIAYSIKPESELAILPIESKSGMWKGNEYLQLYPEMQIKTSNLDTIEANEVGICFSNERYVSLEAWFN
jgi:hypothetical protein